MTVHLMEEVASVGTAAPATELGKPAAGKTGTTNDSVDVWFVGFTRDLLAGVWLGYDDNRRPLGRFETGAGAALLTDYALIPREQRNILRLMFGSSRVREAQVDWRSVARSVVGAFRVDVARAGAGEEISRLVEELSRLSPEFEALWRDNDVVAHGEGLKRIRHPDAGLIELEFSAFAVDGRPELSMVVYNPASLADADRIRTLIAAKRG